MKDSYQRCASVTMIMAIVVTAIASPMLAAPAAASGDDKEPWEEEMKESACAAGGVVVTLFSKCSVEYGDVDGATAEQVRWDVYSDSVFMADSRSQTITEKQSYIEQTQGIALAHAKRELIKCMNNGKSQAVCEDQARQKVTEVFAEVQKSLYVSQNRQMKHWQMMNQQVNQTDNLDGTVVYPYETNPSDWETGFRQVELELYNGETMNVTKGYYKYISGDGGDTIYSYPYYYNGKTQGSQGDSFGVQVNDHTNLNVVSPDGETTIALDGQDYQQALTTLDSKYQATLSEVHPMANDIYANYEPGEVTASEISGPLETMVTSATSNDPLTYRIQSAMVAGYSVNTAGKTVKIKADFNGDNTIGTNETKTGVIYSEPGAFANNKVGTQTYSANDITGNVTFIEVREGAEPQSYAIGDQQFTVEKIYTKDGSTTNSMTLETNDFATTNTKDLNKQIDDIIQKLDKLEKSYSSDSTSPFGGLSGGISSFLNEFGTALLGILALLAGGWFLK